MLQKFLSRKFVAFLVVVFSAFAQATFAPKLDLQTVLLAAAGYAGLNLATRPKPE